MDEFNVIPGRIPNLALPSFTLFYYPLLSLYTQQNSLIYPVNFEF